MVRLSFANSKIRGRMQTERRVRAQLTLSEKRRPLALGAGQSGPDWIRSCATYVEDSCRPSQHNGTKHQRNNNYDDDSSNNNDNDRNLVNKSTSRGGRRSSCRHLSWKTSPSHRSVDSTPSSHAWRAAHAQTTRRARERGGVTSLTDIGASGQTSAATLGRTTVFSGSDLDAGRATQRVRNGKRDRRRIPMFRFSPSFCRGTYAAVYTPSVDPGTSKTLMKRTNSNRIQSNKALQRRNQTTYSSEAPHSCSVEKKTTRRLHHIFIVA